MYRIFCYQVSIEAAWKIVNEEDRKAKERSVAHGGWSSARIPEEDEEDNANTIEPVYIEDFSGSDSNADTVKDDAPSTPKNLVTYEDSNAVNSMMQGLYAQSTSRARSLVTQSAPASPAAKRDAVDGPRTPDAGGGGVGVGGQNSSRDRVAKSSSGKKKVKKNDRRESTHDSMAILKELRDETREITSSKSKNLSVPKKPEKKFRYV